MLPAGTRCPASAAASGNSRSDRSKPCMTKPSQMPQHPPMGGHAFFSSLLGGEALDLAHLVGRVERRDLVGLRQRRVVKDGVDQVVDGAAAAHHRLADVHKLGGPGAEYVHAEQ